MGIVAGLVILAPLHLEGRIHGVMPLLLPLALALSAILALGLALLMARLYARNRRYDPVRADPTEAFAEPGLRGQSNSVASRCFIWSAT